MVLQTQKRRASSINHFISRRLRSSHTSSGFCVSDAESRDIGERLYVQRSQLELPWGLGLMGPPHQHSRNECVSESLTRPGFLFWLCHLLAVRLGKVMYLPRSQFAICTLVIIRPAFPACFMDKKAKVLRNLQNLYRKSRDPLSSSVAYWI